MAKDLKRRIVAEFSAKNRAKGVMAGFRRDMDTTGRALRRMAMGALAVAGIGGLGYMLKKQMEVIDSTAKLSRRLNIATEDLIAMQHGAGIAGVEQETFNKSLEIFVRRLGEVDMGVGQATYALDKLGLNYKELIGLPVDEAFGIIADQIKGLATQAEKAAAANYLFGRSGQALLNYFEEGSKGLKKYKEFVEKTGMAFSDLDAAQVEAANDALMNARAVMTGLFRQATIQLAPYIEVLADKFVDTATAGEGLGANVVNAFESMSMAAIRFGDVFQGLSAKFKAFQAGALEGAAGYLEVAAKIEKYSLGWGVAAKVGRKAIGVEGPAEMAERYRQQAAELMEEAGRSAAGTYGQENAVRRFYNDLRKKAAGRREALEKKARERIEAGVSTRPEEEQAKIVESAERKKMQALEKRVDEEIKMLGRLNEPRQHAKMLIDYETEAMKEFGKGTQETAAAMEVFRGKLEELEEAQKWAEVAKSMETSFAGALERLSQDWRDYGEVAKQVLYEILMETMRIMAWRPAAQALAGVMQPALAGLAGALGGLVLGPGGGMPTVGTVTPAAGATMAKYQYGGTVKETGPAWVHKGEEITPPGRGRDERNIVVNVNNDDRVLGPVEITRAESYVFSDERIINLSIQAAQTNARYRKSHGIG